MAKKEANNYFAMMAEMAERSYLAAERLESALTGFNPAELDGDIAEMHRIESEADQLKHVLVKKLLKEFITPIDREDIMALTACIDDVTDAVEDVLLKMYMFNVTTVYPEAVEFAGIAKRCCAEMHGMFKAFSDFKKSNAVHDSIIELNRLEETGDALYIKAVRGLHTVQAADNYAWTKIYTCLETVCDTCEHAADIVEHVILKNT